MLQKLTFNKVTITDLNTFELGKVNGGLPPLPNSEDEVCPVTYLCSNTCATDVNIFVDCWLKATNSPFYCA